MSDLADRLNPALAGRYEVLTELGRGGMATVFSARDLRHGREVALKVVHPAVAMAFGSDRFVQEIEHAARLQHPHILPLLDSGRAGNLPFYVMPLVRGQSVRQRLDREGQLPVPDAIAITVEVADALAYAHREGLVHRDIKPENILLQDGHALVTDFGIARELDAADRRRLTETGISVGTPLYMSPEQGAAERRIDGRSDQYSLACVLYEMLAGSPPFMASSQQAVLARHARDPVPPITTVRATVPVAVELALERALSKVPADRYPDTAAFAAALTAPTPPRARESSAWRKWRWVAASLFLLLGGAAFVRAVMARPEALAPDPHRIAVFPFTIRCTAGTATWCEGVPQLIGATFTGAGGYSAVDSRAVVRAIKEGPAAPGLESRLAPRLGAGYYVLGDVSESGSTLRITASLYRSGDDDAAVAQATTQGGSTEIFRLIDDLAAQLMAGLEPGEAGRLTRLARATTDSLNALKLFLSSEAQIRAGQFDSALTLLKQAVLIDSTFTVGWARLAEVAGFTEELDQVTRGIERAARGLDRLPWRDSMLVVAMLTPDFADADRTYLTMLRRDSTDPAIWGAWADHLLHEAAMRGRPFAEAAGGFARAIALGDTSWRNVNHLSWATGVQGDKVRYAEALRLGLTRFPDGFMAPIYRLELAVSQQDSAAMTQALSGLRASGIVMAWGAATRLAITGSPEAAERPAMLLTTPEQPLSARVLGYQLLATFKAAQGRWREAWQDLTLAAGLDPLSSAETAAYLALVPGSPSSREVLESLSVVLEHARLPLPSVGESYVFPHNGVHGVLRGYLRGQIASRLGDPIMVERAADALAATAPPDAEGLVRSLTASLKARALYLRGRLPESLYQLETLPHPGDVMRANGSAFYSQVDDRLLRAELLDRLGRSSEALTWFDNTVAVSVMDVAYLPHALRRSGQILERLGRRAEARARYRRLVDLWDGADPELVPVVDQVRERLRSPDLAASD